MTAAKEIHHGHRSRAHHPGAGQESHQGVPELARLHDPRDRRPGGDDPRRRRHLGHRPPRGRAPPRRCAGHPHHLPLQACLPGVPQGRHGDLRAGSSGDGAHRRSSDHRHRRAVRGGEPRADNGVRRARTRIGSGAFPGRRLEAAHLPVRFPGPRRAGSRVPEGGRARNTGWPSSPRSFLPSMPIS